MLLQYDTSHWQLAVSRKATPWLISKMDVTLAAEKMEDFKPLARPNLEIALWLN